MDKGRAGLRTIGGADAVTRVTKVLGKEKAPPHLASLRRLADLGLDWAAQATEAMEPPAAARAHNRPDAPAGRTARS
ncbi:hypothetical protein ACWDA7_37150 [Streptomyces sp. NPDC001156]